MVKAFIEAYEKYKNEKCINDAVDFQMDAIISQDQNNNDKDHADDKEKENSDQFSLKDFEKEVIKRKKRNKNSIWSKIDPLKKAYNDSKKE